MTFPQSDLFLKPLFCGEPKMFCVSIHLQMLSTSFGTKYFFTYKKNRAQYSLNDMFREE